MLTFRDLSVDLILMHIDKKRYNAFESLLH
ncbi:hypothetical protein CI610_03107 [invertebrate metagenome]|uniref:Uncharacterized protein n=1 Tax=invertebrate metagenome TaxID=1711999 RepID=A0A2H9T431_9ZZZZ